MKLDRLYYVTKVLLKGHILNPFWWERSRRRDRRCNVAGAEIPKYFKKYLHAVDSVKDVPAIKNDKNEKIFSMWGWNPITPPMIDACFRSMRANCKQDLVIINEKNIDDYIDLPGYIIDLHNNDKMKNAHFADIIRIEVLHNNGGIWLDSTDFVTSPVPQNIIDEDFFVYMAGHVGSPHGYIQNCFIRSRKNAYLLEAWRAMIFEFWKKDTRFDYFMHQLMFKSIVENNERAKKYFAKMPKIDQDPTHVLWYFYSDKPFNKEIFDKITADAFFQKTAWKHPQAQNPTPGSFADAMIKMYK